MEKERLEAFRKRGRVGFGVGFGNEGAEKMTFPEYENPLKPLWNQGISSGADDRI